MGCSSRSIAHHQTLLTCLIITQFKHVKGIHSFQINFIVPWSFSDISTVRRYARERTECGYTLVPSSWSFLSRADKARSLFWYKTISTIRWWNPTVSYYLHIFIIFTYLFVNATVNFPSLQQIGVCWMLGTNNTQKVHRMFS